MLSDVREGSDRVSNLSDPIHIEPAGAIDPALISISAEIPIPPPQFDWGRYGFELVKPVNSEEPVTAWKVPTGIIGFAYDKVRAAKAMLRLSPLPMDRLLHASTGETNISFARLEPGYDRLTAREASTAVHIFQVGDVVSLPKVPQREPDLSLTDIHIVTAETLRVLSTPPLAKEIKDSPFAQFSLRGQAAEFERLATEATPLLGRICMAGQATVIYATPNVGKTLIVLKLLGDTVATGLINPSNVFYINADDSSSGFAEKMRLMDDLGVHTLSPGLRGFQAANLITILQRVASEDKARQSLIILDTVKKFVSLMDKSRASAFTQACREVVMRGGTIVGLAHTAKNPNANGSVRYGGTTDVVDDFDAAYTISPLEITGMTKEKIVVFDAIKRRGDNAESAAFSYGVESGISYAERLLSVAEVDADTVGQFQRIEEQRSDEEVIAAVTASIADGITKKMALAKEAALRASVSARAAIRIIEKYTGTDPAVARWEFKIGERGAKAYALLTEPEPLPSPDG